ncbi:PocR ligand-binding domain-containing protein [Methanosphaerula subterraneus]|uniref:PocR ligand-binding domain-containing protein n=1 Tax=Methanosphaerula subterraneus TaxID=3350244 RepID=UPI003F8542AE
MITVLLIDDEPAILDITRLFLERTGAFSVETTASGAEALEKFDSKNYDVIISDYEMPGMNGIELLKALKSRGIDIPFIIFTGKGREVVAVEALTYGATYYLQKGGEPRSQFAVLESLIEQAVQRKRAEEETRLSNLRLAEIVNFLPDPTFAINCEGIVIAWNRAIEAMTGVNAPDIIGRGDYAYAVPFYGSPQPGLIGLLNATPEELDERNYSNARHDGQALIAERTYVSLKGKPTVLWAKATPLCNNEGEVIGAIESIRDVTEQELQMDALQQRVQTLTEPVGDTTRLEFTDLFDIDEIQQIQDAFSDATGVASVIVTPEGTPITRPSNFRRLCAEVIPGAQNGASTGIPSIALPDSGAPISAGDRQIATWQIGQVLIEGDDKETLLEYADRIGADRADCAEGLAGVPQMPREQFEKIAKALFLIARQISALALKNLQQSRMIAERMKAEADLKESREQLRSLIEFLPEAMLLHDLDGRLITVNKMSVEMSGSSSEEAMTGGDVLQLFAPADRERVRKNLNQTLADGAFPITEYLFQKTDGTTIPSEFTFSLLQDRNGFPTSFIGLGRDITERKKGDEAIRMANKKLNLLSSVTRHDVLNQLTSLRGFIDLADEAPDDQARRDLMSKVMEAAERIHHQITFTGDYQEIGLGSPQWQDLGTTIRRAAETLDLQGITLSIEVDAGMVYADPLLEKVFFNLMENAKRYATGLDSIRFSIEEQNADWAVVCTDNGPGIPSSEKERIFTAGYGKNTGYGLFLIAEILSITGLSISETGTPGAGARFEIRVPADRFRCA